MQANAEPTPWTCRDLLVPTRWSPGDVVRIVPDLFEPEIRESFRDKVFAAMALCPHLRFEVRTAYPRIFDSYVRKIADDEMEYKTWRLSVGDMLYELGRGHEATGPGPAWPLKNVDLVN